MSVASLYNSSERARDTGRPVAPASMYVYMNVGCMCVHSKALAIAMSLRCFTVQQVLPSAAMFDTSENRTKYDQMMTMLFISSAYNAPCACIIMCMYAHARIQRYADAVRVSMLQEFNDAADA